MKIIDWLRCLALAAAIGLAGFTLPGCERDAGDHFEDAGESIGDGFEQMGDDIKDTFD
jgi:hypothetical protein